MMKDNRRFLILLRCWWVFALLAGMAVPARAQEVTAESAFADAPFDQWQAEGQREQVPWQVQMLADKLSFHQRLIATIKVQVPGPEDRKSTRLNSSHSSISYAVFCLKK